MTLLELIEQLRECKELTVREHENLPPSGKVRSANDPFQYEVMVTNLSVEKIREFFRLYDKHFGQKYEPHQYGDGTTVKYNEVYLQESCPKCGRNRQEVFISDRFIALVICEKCNWCETLGEYVEQRTPKVLESLNERTLEALRRIL